MEESLRKYIFILMKNLNVYLMIFLSLVIARSIYGFAHFGQAKTFLNQVPTLPMGAEKIILITALSCVILLLFMHAQAETVAQLVLKTLVEIFAGVCACYALGFSYTGVILLILADVMRHLPKEHWIVPVFLAVGLYMTINYDMVSRVMPIISLDLYLTYYSVRTVDAIEGLRIVIESLNMGLFLGFVILLVREQVSEKERILYLNKKLYQTNQELLVANYRLENYAKEVEEMTQTRERNRLAREIHDTLGHALTGIITGIDACLLLMDVAPDLAKKQLDAISKVARQGMTDVRRSVNALRPDALDKENLGQAIEKCIQEMRDASGTEIDYECTVNLEHFHEDEEDTIFRIVQESITNSIRHGHADQIQIRIRKQFGMLAIYIKDNGSGAKNVKKGFGLHHMEERITMLQGSLYYDGSDGFLIEAKIPIRWGEG